LTGKYILVTGGAGFIGSHLIERLIEKGYFVICLDNFNDYYSPDLKEKNISGVVKNANFELIRGDILDIDLLDDIFSGIHHPQPNKIVHLAAMAGVRSSILNPGIYVDVDVKGTVNLLETAKKYAAEQFIFASSSSVYGTNEKIPFSENDPVELQISPYATSKRAAELFCKTYNKIYDIPVTVLRFFTVYGERQRPDMAISKFFELIMEDKPIPIFGDGSSLRDYTYVKDCIDCVFSAIENPMDFETINIGSGKTISLKALIEIIRKVTGKKIKIKHIEEQAGDVHQTYADISKAKKLLKYNPGITIEEGIRNFYNWYSQVKD